MAPVDARGASLETLDLVVAGVADLINNTLAVVLLNVEYLDDVIDELAEAANRPRAAADTVVSDVIAAIMRIRNVVRDLNALTGDEDADAAEICGSVLRLVRAELSQRVEVVDLLRGPAPTCVPRRQLATATALALGEIQRALATTRATLTVGIEHGEAHVAIGIVVAVGDGQHGLDRDRLSWGALDALLTEAGGHLALAHTDSGFTVEMRLPGPRRV